MTNIFNGVYSFEYTPFYVDSVLVTYKMLNVAKTINLEILKVFM